MASLLSPATTAAVAFHSCGFSTTHSPFSSQNSLFLLSRRSGMMRCSFSPQDIVPLDSLSHLPAVLEFQNSFSDSQKWGFFASAGLVWFYLTARPGVLIGAIDAYLLAPLQLALDTLFGTRRLKRSDFLVTEKLGEGSFGVVYAGVLLPKNSTVNDDVRVSKARAKAMDFTGEFKQRVILKKVKLGVRGAEEFGDYEEWFNYRLSRAAPETCAEFLGSFVADKTNTMFTKGGKWLVWRFEGDRDLADYMKDRSFP
ncbi:PREDICTED: serine/threonine-protein kinase STN8, chloroplastic, partial [Camelina sativa]|uniref:Serine/threonine-protein kinase STN8, chloroplastic n=1 Tax=Camelina sativa TaxID=90675 RepID=A0ABM0VHT7_CAMSA